MTFSTETWSVSDITYLCLVWFILLFHAFVCRNVFSNLVPIKISLVRCSFAITKTYRQFFIFQLIPKIFLKLKFMVSWVPTDQNFLVFTLFLGINKKVKNNVGFVSYSIMFSRSKAFWNFTNFKQKLWLHRNKVSS